jgi:hypothetical protein
MYIQADFESCSDILTCDRTPPKVTFNPIMPYTNVDIFRKNRATIFSKKVWEPLNFYEKSRSNKIIVDFFSCHQSIIQFITNGFYQPGQNPYGFDLWRSP